MLVQLMSGHLTLDDSNKVSFNNSSCNFEKYSSIQSTGSYISIVTDSSNRRDKWHILINGGVALFLNWIDTFL